MFRLHAIIGMLIVALLSPSAVPGVHAQTSIYFDVTGHSITGRFLQFWQQNGGLPVFGYPLSDELQEDGRTVQYFERQRFELHPENPAPYDVLLGRLGDELLQARGIDWRTQPASPGPAAGCLYFEMTRHNVCNQQPGNGFLTYWTGNGLEFDGRPGTSYAESLALFGYPLTEPYQYTNSSGDTVQAQWFERARFEWHPGNPAQSRVLLGRLGAEVLALQPGSDGAVSIDTEIAAAETVLDYYRAINDQQYDVAYQLWIDNGAASGQTFAEFQQGYANTARVRLILDTPIVRDADTVDVPVTIYAVVNVPRGDAPTQRVDQYGGTYVVHRNAAGEWKPASATINPIAGPLPPSAVATAEKTLRSYYNAIDSGAFARAYTLWNDLGAASGQSYEQFRKGFVDTAGVMVDLGTPRGSGAAGSVYVDVPIVVFATQQDGSQHTFCGTYTLRQLNVPPFDQLGFRIEQAQIKPTANVAPHSPEAQQLLNGGC